MTPLNLTGDACRERFDEQSFVLCCTQPGALYSQISSFLNGVEDPVQFGLFVQFWEFPDPEHNVQKRLEVDVFVKVVVNSVTERVRERTALKMYNFAHSVCSLAKSLKLRRLFFFCSECKSGHCPLIFHVHVNHNQRQLIPPDISMSKPESYFF